MTPNALQPPLSAHDRGQRNGFSDLVLARAITPRHQGMLVFPTEKCQFRCSYCYEDFEIGRMPDRLQLALERFISRRMPEIDSMYISWFGGEPLLAKDVVLRICRHAFSEAQKHNVHFSGGFTTNGYILTQELAEELLSLGQNFFQITLDGPREVHNLTRKLANGRGTFDVIWGNLLRMREIKQHFMVVLRLHVYWGNIEAMESLDREVARAFGRDSRFQLDIEHLRDFGGEGGGFLARKMSFEDLQKLDLHYRQIAKEEVSGPSGSIATSTGVVGDGLQKTAAEESSEGTPGNANQGSTFSPYICYATKPNNILLRANGRIGRCTVALNDERNDVGYMDDDGLLVLNQAKLTPWFRGLGTLDETTIGCPMRGMSTESLPSPYPEGKGMRRIIPLHPRK